MPIRRSNKYYRSREYLTVKEVGKLLEAAKVYGRYPVRNYALVLFVFRHGLRASEACELKWDAISFDEQEVYIQRKKNSDDGVHPLARDEIEALQALRDLKIKSPYVFASERSDRLQVDGFRRLLTRLTGVAGLTIKVHPHQLRHACGYYLVNAGYSTRFIQDYLGHRDIRHTERYTKLNPKRFSSIDWNRTNVF